MTWRSPLTCGGREEEAQHVKFLVVLTHAIAALFVYNDAERASGLLVEDKRFIRDPADCEQVQP